MQDNTFLMTLKRNIKDRYEISFWLYLGLESWILHVKYKKLFFHCWSYHTRDIGNYIS